MANKKSKKVARKSRRSGVKSALLIKSNLEILKKLSKK